MAATKEAERDNEERMAALQQAGHTILNVQDVMSNFSKYNYYIKSDKAY